MSDLKRIDPRVFVQNFAMEPEIAPREAGPDNPLAPLDTPEPMQPSPPGTGPEITIPEAPEYGTLPDTQGAQRGTPWEAIQGGPPAEFQDDRPWKVSVNSDGTVNIGAGTVFYHDMTDTPSGDDPLTAVSMPVEFDGLDNQDLDGYIYIKCPATPLAFLVDNSATTDVNMYEAIPGVIAIVGSEDLITKATAAADHIYRLVARVGTEDGAKVLLRQYLFDNPVLGYKYATAGPS